MDNRQASSPLNSMGIYFEGEEDYQSAITGVHNPLWIIRNNELLITKAYKQLIENFRSQEPFTTHSFDLQKNDLIYMFSD